MPFDHNRVFRMLLINLLMVQTVTDLQSVSANFTRSSSELYSEIDKWAGNFVITFRNSEAISDCNEWLCI